MPIKPTRRGDAKSVLPLHHRIYVVLRRRLVEGKYPLDGAIPGEHQLAEDFQASRVTIRRVLEQLQKEGLVDRRHGAGTFPLSGDMPKVPRPDLSYYDYIAASSHTHEDKLLEFIDIPTPRFLLSVDPHFAPLVVKIVRVAFIEKAPVHILRTFVPADIGGRISRRALGNKTVLEVLKKKGVVAHESELRIGAILADSEESRVLEVPLGAPLLQGIRVSRQKNGRAIEYHQMVSVADKFGYRFMFDAYSGRARLPGLGGSQT